MLHLLLHVSSLLYSLQSQKVDATGYMLFTTPLARHSVDLQLHFTRFTHCGSLDRPVQNQKQQVSNQGDEHASKVSDLTP